MTSTNVAPLATETRFKPSAKIRKRAPKACLSCRSRKVRCDVSQRGSPCMNCFLDNETCVVTGRASRFPTSRDAKNNVQAAYPPYNADDCSHDRTAENVVRLRLNGESNSPSASNTSAWSSVIQQPDNSNENTMNAEMHEDLEKSLPNIYSAENNQSFRGRSAVPLANAKGELFFTATRRILTAIQDPPLPTGMPNLSSFLASETPLWAGDQGVAINADIIYSYYPFLSINNLHNIMPQDVNYLQSQGCFRVPTREILDEFVQQYYLHFHPLLPMIHEGDFWDMYGRHGCGGSGDRMSLLVFQCMLFVSCNFVSRSSIKALGFVSIRAARAALYRRCKLLYDFDSESSMVYLAQAALLLSYWSPNFTHAFKKANSTWLGAAIQNARSAEAHHYSAIPVISATVSPAQYKKHSMLKRLWWCCIVRDRILPLGLRRCLKITRSHFDFDAHPGIVYSDLADEANRSKVYSVATKRCLIEIFIQIVELCTVLTDLIMLVFPLDDSPGWGKKIGIEEHEKVKECKHALRRWYKEATLRFPMFGGDTVPRMTVAGGKEMHHDSVILYQNMMYMYYHSSRVALSHHEVLQTAAAAASPNLTSNLREFSSIYENRHELQDAASGVTECLKELIQLKLARWLPISAVACTALPLVLHIIDVKLSTCNKKSLTATSPQEALKQHRLNILIEAMKTYQPQYDGVDYVSETIRHIVTLAQLDTPASPLAASNAISDWTDILASQPGCYLRLAMTMDLSLSKGRLPEESDFPASLRGLFTAGYSSVKALMGSGKAAQLPAHTPSQQFLNQHAGLPRMPETVRSISSYADTDSLGSAFASSAQRTLFHHEDDMNLRDSFVDAALEIEGLAGKVPAVYSLQNDSPPSSHSSDGDGQGAFYDGERGGADDWIGEALGNEPPGEERSEQETARVLLDAIGESGEVEFNGSA